MSLDPGFSTAKSREIFGSANRLRSLLEVEAALSQAVSAAGLVPTDAAEAISNACRSPGLDADEVFARGWEEGSPVIPLVAALRAAVGDAHAEAVHFGATTQDIVDTGMVLQIAQGLERLEHDVRSLGSDLVRLASEHRTTLRVARTLLQPAGPTTFGMTVATWLGALTRDLGRLVRARSDLALQLGGAVGDQAAWGEQAEAVAADMAGRLGLKVPPLPWHSARDRVGELAGTLALLCQSSAKIAGDLLLLAQEEVGEVSMRAGGSSAMPHKRNPIDAVRTVAAARFAAGQAALLLAPFPHELERAAGSWQLEWVAVPNLFHGTLAATHGLKRAVETLEVHSDRMASHLERLPAGVGAESGPQTQRLIDRALDAWNEASG